MDLFFNQKIAKSYKNQTQKIRVLSESWVDNSMFCPNCGNLSIDKYPNNQPVADFYCSNCKEEYELKSKREKIGKKIVDGAYFTMVKRLRSQNNPNFFLLNYCLPSFKVKNFFVVPKHFFVPEIIEKRNPLAMTARRAGWVGCNILLQNIPKNGKIFFVEEGQIKPKKKVLAEWQRTLFLREDKKLSAKGWLLDIMRCIDRLSKKEFSLNEVYSFESYLSKLHPENKHIKDKIRQQLQILRDRDYLKFMSRGYYKVTQ
ncbi:MAG: DpnI domain-containing protein [Patescibacteria group bacterium]